MGRKKKDKSQSPERGDVPATTGTRRKATSWNADQDKYMIQLLMEKKEEGKMSENSFKKQVFSDVASTIEKKYPAGKGAAPKEAKSVNARWQKVCYSILYS